MITASSKQIYEFVGDFPPPFACVLSSPAANRIVTALAWLTSLISGSKQLTLQAATRFCSTLAQPHGSDVDELTAVTLASEDEGAILKSIDDAQRLQAAEPLVEDLSYVSLSQLHGWPSRHPRARIASQSTVTRHSWTLEMIRDRTRTSFYVEIFG
jgi:hypothetical protein